MNWRDVLAVLLGIKKPQPVLIPIPKEANQSAKK
jgi:hypothetical protein